MTNKYINKLLENGMVPKYIGLIFVAFLMYYVLPHIFWALGNLILEIYYFSQDLIFLLLKIAFCFYMLFQA